MFSKKESQVISSRRIAGCCRRVLVVVLVSALLMSACSPSSSVSVQQALEVLEETFTDEELDGLREVFTDEDLESMAGVLSGEELARVLGWENSVWNDLFYSGSAAEEDSRFIPTSSFHFAEVLWAELENLPDEELRFLAFSLRAGLEGGDPFGFDANDVTTPTGAFCWVVLRLRDIMPDEVELLCS